MSRTRPASQNRGIDHDAGTAHTPGEDSRPDRSPARLRRHLGFGLVACEMVDTSTGPRHDEVPRAAFHEIARRCRCARHH